MNLILPPAAALLGLVVGLIIGRARGKRDLAFYKAGMEETLNRRQCWVQLQVPTPTNKPD